MKGWLTVFSLLLISPISFGLSTIELRQGGEIKAEVLQEKPEHLFVDLGFTVLAIPHEAISSVYTEEPVGHYLEYGQDLYRTLQAPSTASLKELVKRNTEAVVMIRTPTTLGSGFIIHPQGYVITNDHVVIGEHEIAVTIVEVNGDVTEKVQFDHVRIVATNSDLDLALLKIEELEGRTLKTISLGDSDAVRQGQAAFAIGTPLGLERTVSQGIVSSKNRFVGGRLYLQTTALISPGNSGGPLFNMRGEVIGVNTMKIVAAGAEGLAFAIPSNVLKTFLKNRDAFAFDPRNPNSGFRYNSPPTPVLHRENKNND